MIRWLVLIILAPAPAIAQDIDWDKALKEIKRAAPSTFTQLPASIRTRLDGLGCTIPQTHLSQGLDNVTKGNFATPFQTDWAALCSRNDSSELMVFWGGKSRCPDLGKEADRNSLQGIGDRKAGYSRSISATDRRTILEHYKSYRGPKPSLIDHDGLDDAFLGKGSLTLYCYRGKWIHFQGAD